VIKSLLFTCALALCAPGLNGAATTNTGAAAESAEAIEKDYQKLLSEDDAAQETVDRWIQENQAFAAKGAGIPSEQLNRRIEERFAPVRQGYENFLKKHPDHVKGRIAYGSFLGDLGDEAGATVQYEKALALDPKNPAVYNNLANIYGHSGPIKKAFEFYEKALQLNPLEPVYHHNFGTTVYLFRKDAREHYGLDENAVFAKAFGLYSNAMRLDPKNFPLASDVAQTYYGIQPLRTEEALKAWTNALNLARDEIEREGVYVHFARIKGLAGRLDEARAHLNSVTNEMYAELKDRLLRNVIERRTQTNTVDGTAGSAASARTEPIPAAGATASP
jgi:tetratricopeptide (TPR) repeat protein